MIVSTPTLAHTQQLVLPHPQKMKSRQPGIMATEGGSGVEDSIGMQMGEQHRRILPFWVQSKRSRPLLVDNLSQSAFSTLDPHDNLQTTRAACIRL